MPRPAKPVKVFQTQSGRGTAGILLTALISLAVYRRGVNITAEHAEDAEKTEFLKAFLSDLGDLGDLCGA
jgi:hypothetical protein